MKVIKTQMFIGVALLAGVAIGYFAGGHGDVARPDGNEGYVAQKAVTDKGEAASVQALRTRVAELEKALAEKGEQTETAVSNAVAEASKNASPWRGNPQEWLENLKKTDPERYVQTTNRWAQWRKRRAEQTQSQFDFLSSVDVSRLGAKAQENHNALLDAIVRREEIVEELHQEGTAEDRRHELMRQLMETDREMRVMTQTERSSLIMEAVRNSGVKGKMVGELTATIKDVIKATESHGFGGHHGGHRGRRGR